MTQQSEAQVGADLARALSKVDTVTIGDEGHGNGEGLANLADGKGGGVPVSPRTVLSVPSGRTIKSIKPLLDEYRKRPERRRGRAVADDAQSFAAMVNRSKGESTALFASKCQVDEDGDSTGKPGVLAVIDYNETGAETPSEERARHCEHRIAYSFPVSPEWTVWAANARSTMTQRTFAAFLEEHITDVIAKDDVSDDSAELLELIGAYVASPGELMALSKGLALTVKQKVTNAANLATGEAQMLFETEHKDAEGKPLRVPGAFLLGIPVFESGETFQVLARLSYTVSEGKVTWSYSLHRAPAVFDVAFRESCQSIQAWTKLPLYFGSPEAG